MKREELETLLKYAEKYPKQKVLVTVRKEDSEVHTNVDIESFNVYSDTIVLNVTVGKDF